MSELKIELHKNVTNGDVIKTMFPQLKVNIFPDMVIVFGEDYIFQHYYPIEWWNAPYEIESEK